MADDADMDEFPLKPSATIVVVNTMDASSIPKITEQDVPVEKPTEDAPAVAATASNESAVDSQTVGAQSLEVDAVQADPNNAESKSESKPEGEKVQEVQNAGAAAKSVKMEPIIKPVDEKSEGLSVSQTTNQNMTPKLDAETEVEKPQDEFAFPVDTEMQDGTADTVPKAAEERGAVNCEIGKQAQTSAAVVASRPVIKIDGLTGVSLDSDFNILRLCSDRGMAQSGMSGIEDRLKWSGEVHVVAGGDKTKSDGESQSPESRFLEVYQLSSNEMLEVIKLYRKLKSQPRDVAVPTNKVSPIKLEKEQPDDDESVCKLHLQGLSYETTTADIRTYFAQFGEVKDCVVIPDHKTKKSRGFGFVTFRKKKVTDKILKASPHTIGGRSVKAVRATPLVTRANPRGEEAGDSTFGPGFSSEFFNKPEQLLVRGVTEQMSETEFRRHFARFGRVLTARVFARDRLAVIEFANARDVESALGVGHEINGVPVEVLRFRPRSDHTIMAPYVLQQQLMMPQNFHPAPLPSQPTYDEYSYQGYQPQYVLRPPPPSIPKYYTEQAVQPPPIFRPYEQPAQQPQPSVFRTAEPVRYVNTAAYQPAQPEPPYYANAATAAPGPMRNDRDLGYENRPAPYPEPFRGQRPIYRDEL